jgi:hypothetical protein
VSFEVDVLRNKLFYFTAFQTFLTHNFCKNIMQWDAASVLPAPKGFYFSRFNTRYPTVFATPFPPNPSHHPPKCFSLPPNRKRRKLRKIGQCEKIYHLSLRTEWAVRITYDIALLYICQKKIFLCVIHFTLFVFQLWFKKMKQSNELYLT